MDKVKEEIVEQQKPTPGESLVADVMNDLNEATRLYPQAALILQGLQMRFMSKAIHHGVVTQSFFQLTGGGA